MTFFTYNFSNSRERKQDGSSLAYFFLLNYVFIHLLKLN